jgi:hypothetical protein
MAANANLSVDADSLLDELGVHEVQARRARAMKVRERGKEREGRNTQRRRTGNDKEEKAHKDICCADRNRNR